METNLLRVPQVARMLAIPEATVYDMARRGTLPGLVRVGRLIRFDERKLAAWLDQGGQALPGGWRREPL